MGKRSERKARFLAQVNEEKVVVVVVEVEEEEEEEEDEDEDENGILYGATLISRAFFFCRVTFFYIEYSRGCVL